MPVVVQERLRWKRRSFGAPFRFLDYSQGQGQAVSGEVPDDADQKVEIPLSAPDLLAVNALGQFQEHPRVAALRNFIMGWHVSYLSADSARGQPEAGPQEQLTRTGDNLANVVQYLAERHPERLERIFNTLRQRVPRIERVLTETMADGRLLLQIKDAPFSQPVLARFASDGTLKMLAYLVLLYDPEPPPFIGIEEPENFLHPRLLPELAEECSASCEPHAIARHYTLAVFPCHATARGGSRLMARRGRSYANAASCRLAWSVRVCERGRTTWRFVDRRFVGRR